MRRPAPALLPVLLVGALAAPTAPAQQPSQPPPPPSDEQVLQNAGLSPTADALLDFFRTRARPAGDPEQIPNLVRQLRDPGADVRERAAARLVAWGPAAIPWLREGSNDLDDPEAAGRARQCLAAVESPGGSAVTTAAVHVLARLRPAGAAEALLEFLPFADDDRLVEQTGEALQAVALHDGKADASLVRALKDPDPLRRRVAGELLARGGPDGRAAARALLDDPRPAVRLKVALALAEAGEADAVPALIDLVGRLPEARAGAAEDYLSQLAGEWAVHGPRGDDVTARKVCHDVWATWWRAVDPAALLAEVRGRCLPDDDVRRARRLLDQLGDPSERVRERARAGLLALGPNVVPLLREVADTSSGGDRHAAVSACLQVFADQGAAPPLPPAAVRLLALRKPAGAVDALLAYLPLATDDAMANEMQTALSALALRDGKPEAALVAALADRLPVRRAVAAEVVCRTGREAGRALVRPLLLDPDPQVRLRAAVVLAAARETEAVPVLIALLTELPAGGGEQAEDFLRQLAGDHAPEVALGTDEAGRRKCRDAWAGWWRDQGSRADLPALDPAQRLHGYTVIVEMYNPLHRGGRVFEVDAAGKVRWSIDGLQGPTDAQVLPGDRVLITEQNANRVTERDFKGKVLWEETVTNVLRCERLRNGHMLAVCRNQVRETDRAGKEVFSYTRPGNDIVNACRLRDGQYALVTTGFEYLRLDATAKVRKTGHTSPFPLYHLVHSVEILPNDRVLIAEYTGGRVTEQDVDGKVVWQQAAPGAVGVSRLPNGHTLIAAHNPTRVNEVDRKGNLVWEYKEGVSPYYARRR
jgi:HEAT repeat protein